MAQLATQNLVIKVTVENGKINCGGSGGDLTVQGKKADNTPLQVTWVSDEGKELLAMMHRQGAELVTSDVLMSAIVAEIVESAAWQSTEERGR